jgi:hypothetical protein
MVLLPVGDEQAQAREEQVCQGLFQGFVGPLVFRDLDLTKIFSVVEFHLTSFLFLSLSFGKMKTI